MELELKFIKLIALADNVASYAATAKTQYGPPAPRDMCLVRKTLEELHQEIAELDTLGQEIYRAL